MECWHRETQRAAKFGASMAAKVGHGEAAKIGRGAARQNDGRSNFFCKAQLLGTGSLFVTTWSADKLVFCFDKQARKKK
jgi:hypothetical protein